MLDEDFDLKAKITDVLECAAKEVLALVEANRELEKNSARHAWEGACKQAKISGLRFHDLRHTFATRLRAKGVHEMDIMTLLGHTTLQIDVALHSYDAAELADRR